MRRGDGSHEGQEDRQQHRQPEGPPGDDTDAEAGPQADADHGGGGQDDREHGGIPADDEAVGDRQATPIRAVATVCDDHRGGTHDGALGDRVQGRDEQDHLCEDEEDPGDQEQVLPRVRGQRGLR